MDGLPTANDLVDAAKTALGAISDNDLALRLWEKYKVRTDQPGVSRWRRGLRGPSYTPTIALLDAAGWLNEKAIDRSLEKLAEARQAADAGGAAAARIPRAQPPRDAQARSSTRR